MPVYGPPDRWSTLIRVRATAMVLAGETLVVAGFPDTMDTDNPWAAYEGRRGGKLLVVSVADGSELVEIKLDSPPVFDGLIAAGGRLYMSDRAGRVTCMAGQ